MIAPPLIVTDDQITEIAEGLALTLQDLEHHIGAL